MLRPYQKETLGAIVTALDAGIHRQLVAKATGTGKTVDFSNLPLVLGTRIPGQMWVLAHREELIDQAVAKIRHWNPSLVVDKEMAEHYANPFADVIVSCVASVGRKGTKRTDRFDWDAVTRIVIDEAHHSTASTYQNFLELAGVLRSESYEVTVGGAKVTKTRLVPTNAPKLLVGFTATPKRGDGVKLGDLYEKIVYSYPIRKAIEDGWLVDLRGYRVRSTTDLDGVSTNAGDFQTGELADAVNNPVRNMLVVKSWLDKGEGKQTIGFCVDIKHACDLAETFRGAGIKAAAVWGNDPDRAEKLRAHKAREITVLLNCGVLTEGYDDWQIGCVILARPTKSGSLYTQMVGRGTRLQDGTGNLLEAIAAGVQLEKTECIVIDICDTTRRHSLQTVPTLLGLDGSKLDLNGQLAVKSVRELEAAQAANPHIDFSKLDDITKLKAYIESVSLWDKPSVPEEVAASSKLDWHKRADGSYMLMLRSEEVDHFFRKSIKIPVYKQKTVYITENILGKFEIISVARTTASDKGAAVTAVQSKAEANSLEDAFRAVDNAVSKAGQDAYLVRDKVSTGPHSEPQHKAVVGYYKKQLGSIPFCTCAQYSGGVAACPICKKPNMTRTQASNLIAAAQAKKRG